MKANPAAPAAARGSVMLEALMSIVVTSLAMLATASLAVNAAKVNQSSRYRAQAVLLANDLGERIGANPAAAAAGVFAVTGGGSEPDEEEGEETAEENCNDGPCSPGARAQADVASWLARVAASLPDSTAQIAFTPVDGVTPARYTITLNWVERMVGHGGAARATTSTTNTETFAFTATVLLPPR